MDLGPSPVSWTVVPRFNRVGSYIPENSTEKIFIWAKNNKFLSTDASKQVYTGNLMFCTTPLKYLIALVVERNYQTFTMAGPFQPPNTWRFGFLTNILDNLEFLAKTLDFFFISCQDLGFPAKILDFLPRSWISCQDLGN